MFNEYCTEQFTFHVNINDIKAITNNKEYVDIIEELALLVNNQIGINYTIFQHINDALLLVRYHIKYNREKNKYLYGNYLREMGIEYLRIYTKYREEMESKNKYDLLLTIYLMSNCSFKDLE